jgi:hypothetical protein
MDTEYIELPAYIARVMLDLLQKQAYPSSDHRWQVCEISLSDGLKNAVKSSKARLLAGECELAKELGYTVRPYKGPGIRFIKGARHIWSVKDGWQTCNWREGHFATYCIYPTLTEALGREL